MILLAILSAIIGIKDESNIKKEIKNNELQSIQRAQEFNNRMKELREWKNKKYY